MWFPKAELLLRPAVAGDGDLIAAMCARLSRDEGSPRSSRFTAEIFRRDGFGPRPLFRCVVAELSGAPAGYVLHCPDYDTDHLCRGIYMADLYVEKAARGRGIGRALMAAAAADGQQDGAAVMTWSAFRHNTPALDFYRRIGHENSDLIEYMAEDEQFQALATAAERPAAAFCLRPARPEDCPVLAEFLGALYRAVGRPPVEDMEGRLRRDGFGVEPAFAAIIAETTEHVPIAYALFWQTYTTESAMSGGLLSDLYVVPAWRRRGVARALMAAAARTAAEAGGRFLVWAVDAGNIQAREFYRTLSREAPEQVVCGCDGQQFVRLAEDARTWRR
jgi:ribosomal protein S18 acetylase RimI-like enzyme